MFPRIVDNKPSVKETLVHRSFSGPDPVSLRSFVHYYHISASRSLYIPSSVFWLLPGHEFERTVQSSPVRCHLVTAIRISSVGDDKGLGHHAV